MCFQDNEKLAEVAAMLSEYTLKLLHEGIICQKEFDDRISDYHKTFLTSKNAVSKLTALELAERSARLDLLKIQVRRATALVSSDITASQAEMEARVQKARALVEPEIEAKKAELLKGVEMLDVQLMERRSTIDLKQASIGVEIEEAKKKRIEAETALVNAKRGWFRFVLFIVFYWY